MATNFGDTLASELGILSTSPPRYILTGKTVPPGTNGGVSPYGLLMSALGGTAIGAVMVLDLMAERSCWGNGWAVEMVLFGTAMGFLGSLVSFPPHSSNPFCTISRLETQYPERLSSNPQPDYTDFSWTLSSVPPCKKPCTRLKINVSLPITPIAQESESNVSESAGISSATPLSTFSAGRSWLCVGITMPVNRCQRSATIIPGRARCGGGDQMTNFMPTYNNSRKVEEANKTQDEKAHACTLRCDYYSDTVLSGSTITSPPAYLLRVAFFALANRCFVLICLSSSSPADSLSKFAETYFSTCFVSPLILYVT